MSLNLNADNAEIVKFNNIANQWWDVEGPMAMLHKINPFRIKFIQDQADLNNSRILDVGCGGGILTEALAQLSSAILVTGIDLAKTPLTVAKAHAKKFRLRIGYRSSSPEQLAKACPEKYDVITCLEVLEHVPNPKKIIKACAKLAKPGGHIFFSTINRNLKSFICVIIGAEYVLRLLPQGTHSYNKFIKPEELEVWAQECGLALKRVVSMKYNPFFKIFSLQEGADVNYIMHFTRQ